MTSPRITFTPYTVSGTGSNIGWTISNFEQINSVSIDPSQMFAVHLFDTTLEEPRSYVSTEFNVIYSYNNGKHLFDCRLISDPTVQVVLVAEEEEERVAFHSPLVLNKSTTKCVFAVEWPGITVNPFDDPENFYEANGAQGGLIIRKPTTAPSNIITPGNMQFFCFYDWTMPEVLYFWSDDEDFHPKYIAIAQQASNMKAIVVHNFDRLYDTANQWTRPYKFYMEQFYSKAVHGKLAGYEAALKYREWTANNRRPWRSRTNWWSANDIPDAVKNADFHISFTESSYEAVDVMHQKLTGEVLRWKTLVNPYSSPIITIYGWRNPPGISFGQMDPYWTGYMDTRMFTALETLNEEGWSPCLYSILTTWETGNARAGWTLTDYSGLYTGIPNNLTGHILTRRNGSMVTSTQHFPDATPPLYQYFHPTDWSDQVMYEHFAKDLARRWQAEFPTGAKFKGVYHDALFANIITPPSVTGDDSTYHDMSNAPWKTGWSYSTYHKNRSKFMANFASGVSEDGGYCISMTEWPNESDISYFNLSYHSKDIFEVNGWWPGFLEVCHGDVVRYTSYGPPQLIFNEYPTSLGQVGGYINQANLHWLRGGIFSFVDAVGGANYEVVTSDLTGGGLYYFVAWSQRIFSMQEQCMEYFKGHLFRPITADDWKISAIDTNISATRTGWSQFVQGPDLNNMTGWCMSETWKNYKNDLGFIATCTFFDDQIAIERDEALVTAYRDALPDWRNGRQLFVHVDTERDGLDPGEKIVYKTVNGGERTEVDRFNASWSGYVHVPAWSVVLYEFAKS